MKKLFLLVAILSLSACDFDKQSTEFSTAKGKYQGYIEVKTGGKTTQTLVFAEITDKGSKTLNLAIRAIEGDAKWDYDVALVQTGVLKFQGMDLVSDGGTCFVYGNIQYLPFARLCFDGQVLAIQFTPKTGEPVLKIQLDREDLTKVPPMETPAEFTMEALMERAATQGFDTRVQFQQVLMARKNAELASSLLVPHLSAGNIIGGYFNGWNIMLRSLGDLVPFLFPDRWYKASKTEREAEAELYALVIMQADALSIAEGLSYAIARDEEVLEQLNSEVAMVVKIRDQEIIPREQQNGLPAGTSNDLTSIVLSILESVAALRETIEGEYAAMAQTVGFFNPKAISLITTSVAQVNVETPEDLPAYSTLLSVALQRSFELKQIDALLAAARLDRKERLFSWMDPGGDPGGVLGVNLIPYLGLGKVNEALIQEKRRGIQGLLTDKVDRAYGDRGAAITSYQLAKARSAVQDRRVAKNLASLRLDLDFSIADLVASLQDQVKGQIDVINAKYQFYLVHARINRLLMAGPYARW
ncbi:hypothetical protein K2X30_13680 [bacterium]|nr:hypothetical protein [bacterium]